MLETIIAAIGADRIAALILGILTLFFGKKASRYGKKVDTALKLSAETVKRERAMRAYIELGDGEKLGQELDALVADLRALRGVLDKDGPAHK